MKEMLDRLEEALDKVDEIQEEFTDFYGDEFETLCRMYCELHSHLHIESHIDCIMSIGDYVSVNVIGWDRDYEISFPKELFTNPDYLNELVEAKRVKDEEAKRLIDERDRRTYLKLKERFGDD